jgi:hypothetical protein
VIVYGLPRRELSWCGELEEVATIRHPLAMPKDSNLPVFVCRSPAEPIGGLWPRWKSFFHGGADADHYP